MGDEQRLDLPWGDDEVGIWLNFFTLIMDVAPRAIIIIAIISVGWFAGRWDLRREVAWLRAQLEKHR